MKYHANCELPSFTHTYTHTHTYKRKKEKKKRTQQVMEQTYDDCGV